MTVPNSSLPDAFKLRKPVRRGLIRFQTEVIYMHWLTLLIAVSAQHLLGKDSIGELFTARNIAEGIFAFEFPQFEILEQVFKPIEALEAILLAADTDKVVPESCVKQADYCPSDASEEDFMKCLNEDPDCQKDLEGWRPDNPDPEPEPTKEQPVVAFTSDPVSLVEPQTPGVLHYVMMFAVGAGCCAVLIALYFYKFANKAKAIDRPSSGQSSIKLKTFKEDFPFP
mmetsp:Transcript_19131/g.34844  ORF Transcript_19131/g.34844 Transcript_19131/m.34844 type:complete len:226 (+) Transcript_19131:912-1589(+)